MEKVIVYSFEVIDNDYNEVIFEGQAGVKVTEKEIQEVAEIVNENGGHLVSWEQLPDSFFSKAQDGAEECFCQNCTDDIYYDEDEGCYSLPDNVTIDIQLPLDLQLAVDKYLQYKTITVEYYVEVGNRVDAESCEISISNDDFYTLAQIVGEMRDESLTDFEYLKIRNPKLYDNLVYDVTTWANNLHIAKGDGQVKVHLAMLPDEVYDADEF